MKIFDESDLKASYEDGFNRARQKYEPLIEAHKIAKGNLKKQVVELKHELLKANMALTGLKGTGKALSE